MTAVIRGADARRRASIMMRSSMMLWLTGGHVGWMTNTSAPRTFSCTCTNTSPSENCDTSVSARRVPRYSAISRERCGFAFPAVNTRSPGMHAPFPRTGTGLVGQFPEVLHHPIYLFYLSQRACLRLTLVCGSPCGWGGRIRTSGCGIQSPEPYRLATPQYRRARPWSGRRPKCHVARPDASPQRGQDGIRRERRDCHGEDPPDAESGGQGLAGPLVRDDGEHRRPAPRHENRGASALLQEGLQGGDFRTLRQDDR